MSQDTSELRTDSVSRVYAQALFELAAEAGQDQAMADEIDELGDLLAAQPQLLPLLSTPAITAEQRRDIIDRIFKGNVSDTLYRFLQILAGKIRLAHLPAIVQAYVNLVTEQRGVVEVDIFVPAKLDDAQLQRIAGSIGESLGGKEVAPHQYVDESLIGGMKVRIGDQMIDASVASQLRTMRQQMVRRGRHTNVHNAIEEPDQ